MVGLPDHRKLLPIIVYGVSHKQSKIVATRGVLLEFPVYMEINIIHVEKPVYLRYERILTNLDTVWFVHSSESIQQSNRMKMNNQVKRDPVGSIAGMVKPVRVVFTRGFLMKLTVPGHFLICLDNDGDLGNSS